VYFLTVPIWIGWANVSIFSNSAYMDRVGQCECIFLTVPVWIGWANVSIFSNSAYMDRVGQCECIF
jgi:hypothetical protein